MTDPAPDPATERDGAPPQPPGTLLRGTLLYSLANLSFVGLSYLALITIARVLEVERFGEYVFVMSVLMWLELIANEVFNIPYMQELSRGDADAAERTARAQLAFTCSLTALLLLLGALSGHASLALLAAAGLDLAPFALFARTATKLNACGRYAQLSALALTYGVLKFAFMVGAALWSGNLTHILLGMVLASMATAALGVHLASRLPRVPSPDRADASPPSTRIPTLHSIILTVGGGVLLSIDIWMIKLLGYGDRALGEYGAASSITKVFYLFGFSLCWPLLPRIAEAGSVREALRRHRDVGRVLGLVFLGFPLACIALVLTAPWIIQLVFGERYSQAGAYIRVLAPAHVAVTAGLILSRVAYYTERSRPAARAVVAATLAAPILILGLSMPADMMSAPLALLVVGAGLAAVQARVTR